MISCTIAHWVTCPPHTFALPNKCCPAFFAQQADSKAKSQACITEFLLHAVISKFKLPIKEGDETPYFDYEGRPTVREWLENKINEILTLWMLHPAILCREWVIELYRTGKIDATMNDIMVNNDQDNYRSVAQNIISGYNKLHSRTVLQAMAFLLCVGDAGGWMRTKLPKNYDHTQTTIATSPSGVRKEVNLCGAFRWNMHMLMRLFSKILVKDQCQWILGFKSHREFPLKDATPDHYWLSDLSSFAFRHGRYVGFILNPGLATTPLVKQGKSDLRWAHSLQLLQDVDARATVTDTSRFTRGAKFGIKIDDDERATSWQMLWKKAPKNRSRASVLVWKSRKDRERAKTFKFIEPPEITRALAEDSGDTLVESSEEEGDKAAELSAIGDMQSSGSDDDDEEGSDEHREE